MNRAQQLDEDGMRPDKTACVAMGTYTNKATPLTDLVNTGNIAGGCISYGFTAPSAKCGTAATQTTFRDNVAHSCAGGKNGIGAAIHPNPTDPGSGTCLEVSHFTAYKNV